MISAKVIEDSVSMDGKRLTTLQLTYPRFIHAEAKTHRLLRIGSEACIALEDVGFMADSELSRNASSSRAVPTSRLLRQVRENPAMPLHWGKNEPGMQANTELDIEAREGVQAAWRDAANYAADTAEIMASYGAHKQIVNRVLEPFTFIHVVVTATEWDNFFELRCHAAAQPEMRHLAERMRDAMGASKPVERPRERSYANAWHLPYVRPEERVVWHMDPTRLARISAARCARVSYLNHDGTEPDVSKDLALFERLCGMRPRHASPVEHQGYPLASPASTSRNFRGWRQYREVIEG